MRPPVTETVYQSRNAFHHDSILSISFHRCRSVLDDEIGHILSFVLKRHIALITDLSRESVLAIDMSGRVHIPRRKGFFD